jgi:hypothetical protein
MKTILKLVTKFWYVRAARRLAKDIEVLTQGQVAGERARQLARTWLVRNLDKLNRS